MGAYWLHDLPAVIAGAGLDVDTWPGWQDRSRSSGGYDAVYAVFAHHTGSSTSPDNDMSYMWDNAEDRPIGALYLARDGVVTVGAAGATNTQGKGGPWTLSTGTIPLDKGNAYGIAIEAAGGYGDPWPAEQTDAYLVLVAALCSAYGLDVDRDVLAHFEWCEPSCPGRKVDPAGPSPWATGSGSWDMDAFRADAGTGTNNGGFLMSLTDAEQRELYDRVMGSTPGPYADEQRGLGESGDGKRRFALDDQDGNYIVSMLQRIAAELGVE